jgi:hypothetical protein
MRQVEHLDADVLLDAPVVEAVRVGCCRARSGAADEEWNQVPQIVLPRRGLFVVHRYGESVLADPTCAIVFGLEEAYRITRSSPRSHSQEQNRNDPHDHHSRSRTAANELVGKWVARNRCGDLVRALREAGLDARCRP